MNRGQEDTDMDGSGDVCDRYPTNAVHEEPFNPGDSRMNQRPKDRGASAAVFCQAGGYQIWAIDASGQGSYVLTNRMY